MISLRVYGRIAVYPGDVHLAFADAHHERARPVAGEDQALRIIARNNPECVSTNDFGERLANRNFNIAVIVHLDEMR